MRVPFSGQRGLRQTEDLVESPDRVEAEHHHEARQQQQERSVEESLADRDGLITVCSGLCHAATSRLGPSGNLDATRAGRDIDGFGAAVRASTGAAKSRTG